MHKILWSDADAKRDMPCQTEVYRLQSRFAKAASFPIDGDVVCEAVCRLLQQGLLCSKNHLPGRHMSVALLPGGHDIIPALQATRGADECLILEPNFRIV